MALDWNDALTKAAFAIGGGFFTHLWQKYRNRLVPLRWQVNHQPLALSGQNTRFGTIDVNYNGHPVNNVFLSVVDVFNETNRDLADLNIAFVFQGGSRVLMSAGQVVGSANELRFTPGFSAEIDEFMKLPTTTPHYEERGHYVWSRREYAVPVLNRGAALSVTFLVHATPEEGPVVLLSADHLGLKLEFRPQTAMVLGVERELAIVVGMIAGLAAAIGLAVNSLPPWSVSVAAFLIGSLTAGIGAAVVRAWRFLARVLG